MSAGEGRFSMVVRPWPHIGKLGRGSVTERRGHWACAHSLVACQAVTCVD